MANKIEIGKLIDDALRGRIDRRTLLERAAAMGIAVPGVLLMRTPGVLAQGATPEASPVGPAGTPVTFPAVTPDATAKLGGTLRAIVVDDPNSLDIQVTQLAQVRNIMESIYDTLTFLDAADPNFGIKGRLAKGWVFTEPTKLDFMLQEGVTFHDGSPFTADDVVWTVN